MHLHLLRFTVLVTGSGVKVTNTLGRINISNASGGRRWRLGPLGCQKLKAQVFVMRDPTSDRDGRFDLEWMIRLGEWWYVREQKWEEGLS